jgi:hypothetical protein
MGWLVKGKHHLPLAEFHFSIRPAQDGYWAFLFIVGYTDIIAQLQGTAFDSLDRRYATYAEESGYDGAIKTIQLPSKYFLTIKLSHSSYQPNRVNSHSQISPTYQDGHSSCFLL